MNEKYISICITVIVVMGFLFITSAVVLCKTGN